MALTDIEIGLHELKLAMLLVLWNQGQPLDSLILDELLLRERFATLHRRGQGPSRPARGLRPLN
jgi:uncharacterized protein Smg (DUF494 family)